MKLKCNGSVMIILENRQENRSSKHSPVGWKMGFWSATSFPERVAVHMVYGAEVGVQAVAAPCRCSWGGGPLLLRLQTLQKGGGKGRHPRPAQRARHFMLLWKTGNAWIIQNTLFRYDVSWISMNITFKGRISSHLLAHGTQFFALDYMGEDFFIYVT